MPPPPTSRNHRWRRRMGHRGDPGQQNNKLETMLPGQVDRYRIEHNSWGPWDNIHTPDLVLDFHQRHPGAPQQIQLIEFNAITFHSIASSVVPGHHSLEGGMDVRGHPHRPTPLMEYVHPNTPDQLHLANTPYVPPHHR